MRIVVPVKQIVALDDDFELGDDEMDVDPDFVELDLNEWDRFSVEAAVQLREQTGQGTEVVVMTVGSDDAEEALLSCLACGADRAVRVWDESLEAADVLAVARVLASAVECEAPDLVLCGVQSSDAVNGATGVAVAGFLGLPHVAVVKALDYDPAAGFVTVRRELESGLIEVLRIRTPALLTIQTGINEPRYANLRAIKQARAEPIRGKSLGDLGLEPAVVEAASGSVRRALSYPDRGSGAEMIDGSPPEIAARILEIVRDRIQP